MVRTKDKPWNFGSILGSYEIEYVRKSEIIECSCGGRYIRTYETQLFCPECPQYKIDKLALIDKQKT